MTAHLCIGTYNGRKTIWLEMFPVVNHIDKPVVAVEERYELTPEQARMSIDRLTRLLVTGELRQTPQEPSP